VRTTNLICGGLLLTLSGFVFSLAADARNFRCRAVDPRSRNVVFTCSGTEIGEGTRMVRTDIVYRDAKGKMFARESIRYRKDQLAPNVTLTDSTDGRREIIERTAGHFLLVTQDNAKSAAMTTLVNFAEADFATLTLPGIPRYLIAQMGDKPVDTRHVFYCLFVQEKKLLRLRATVEAALKYRGKEALRIRLQPDNFVYRWFSEPVRVTLQKKTGRMLRYEGLHYVRDPRSGHGSIVDVTFSW
jgi:hypothetical protein